MGYTKFKIEARHDHTSFKVLVKGWFGYISGFVHTDYFGVSYPSEKAARLAIQGYKNRFTTVDGEL